MSSFAAFQELIKSRTGIPAARQEILSGFPPRPLVISGDLTVSSSGLSSGDTVTIRQAEAAALDVQPTTSPEDDDDEQLARALAASLEDAGVSPSAQPTAATPSLSASERHPPAAGTRQDAGRASTAPPGRSHAPRAAELIPDGLPLQPAGCERAILIAGPAATSVQLPDGSSVVRRVIDSDNSCLFNAVGYVMERSRRQARHLRQVIAKAVAADPDQYTEAFLGKSNAEYQRWILDSQKWGGAIELSILSRYYQREIAAYDIQTKRLDTYGQGNGYAERVMVLYDGLHYDALAQAAFEGAPEELDVTIFEAGSAGLPAVESAAAGLVSQAHQARQFTDTANFTLRCGICQIGVRGEKEAVQHATQTGHQNFSEYH